ncbi:hypothetical protein [Janthinobacterium psychrotolerans]|uniref:Uncharacterized protein n=1 Tax=Janthinobacterium psychrotolerans TaxID=1747903 RepID=A0A1A7BWC4_9BURK|nr:hypothetical protein [Janthinobacterium psychrotolerans]OBV37049.1 hypothetical protein ASR47_1002100 [Janthinobacterium psychrotolerans]
MLRAKFRPFAAAAATYPNGMNHIPSDATLKSVVNCVMPAAPRDSGQIHGVVTSKVSFNTNPGVLSTDSTRHPAGSGMDAARAITATVYL